MGAVLAANRARADRARHADRAAAPRAPALERNRLCPDERALAEPRERWMPCRPEKDEAGIADALGLRSRHRLGATEQPTRRRAGRVNSDATDDVPAERRPQPRARRRRERRRGESKPANEDHKAQPKHTDIIARQSGARARRSRVFGPSGHGRLTAVADELSVTRVEDDLYDGRRCQTKSKQGSRRPRGVACRQGVSFCSCQVAST